MGDDYERDSTRDGGGTSSTLRLSWSMGRMCQRLVEQKNYLPSDPLKNAVSFPFFRSTHHGIHIVNTWVRRISSRHPNTRACLRNIPKDTRIRHGLKLHRREADDRAARAEIDIILGVELDVSIGDQGGGQGQSHETIHTTIRPGVVDMVEVVLLAL